MTHVQVFNLLVHCVSPVQTQGLGIERQTIGPVQTLPHQGTPVGTVHATRLYASGAPIAPEDATVGVVVAEVVVVVVMVFIRWWLQLIPKNLKKTKSPFFQVKGYGPGFVQLVGDKSFPENGSLEGGVEGGDLNGGPPDVHPIEVPGE